MENEIKEPFEIFDLDEEEISLTEKEREMIERIMERNEELYKRLAEGPSDPK